MRVSHSPRREVSGPREGVLPQGPPQPPAWTFLIPPWPPHSEFFNQRHVGIVLKPKSQRVTVLLTRLISLRLEGQVLPAACKAVQLTRLPQIPSVPRQTHSGGRPQALCRASPPAGLPCPQVHPSPPSLARLGSPSHSMTTPAGAACAPGLSPDTPPCPQGPRPQQGRSDFC